MTGQGMIEEIEEILSGISFEGDIRFMEPMTKHTSLRIGGPADIFVIPHNLPSLKNLVGILKKRKLPFMPLGNGTNILVKDGGIEGVVISLRSFRKIDLVSEDKTMANVYVEAGTPLQRLVHFSKENGYSGMEGLAGIPGSVGGAICGNAGAFGYEMKNVLVSASIMDTQGRVKKIMAEDIEFGYRSSGIPLNDLLLSAEIKLRKDKKGHVAAKIEEFLKKKWETQPISEPSAGCVFKNPSGFSAGKLIDEAGCKGLRIGDIEVSSIHANFFVNRGKATATDYLRLMVEVAQKVKGIFGVVLEPEIRIVGRE